MSPPCATFIAPSTALPPACATAAEAVAALLECRRLPTLLLEDVPQRTDAVDRHFHDVTRLLHRSSAERRAAADHVAREKRHVLRDQPDDGARIVDHVADRIILSLLSIEDG